MTRWLGRIVQIVLAVGVAGVLASRLSWHDRLRLPDGTSARVLGIQSGQYLVQEGEVIARIPHTADAVYVRGFRSVLLQTSPAWMVFAVGLWTTLHMLAAARWRSLLPQEPAPVRFLVTLRWLMTSQLVALLAAGQLGADAVRLYEARKAGLAVTRVLASLVVERILGLAAIAAIAIFGACHLYGQHLIALPKVAIPGGVLRLCIFLAVISAAIAAYCLRHRLAQLITRHQPSLRHCWAALKMLWQDPRRILRAAMASVAIQLLVVGLYGATDRALGLGVSWQVYLAVVPLVQVLMCLPDLHGLVVFEGSMVVLLGKAGGLSTSEVIALCATLRCLELGLRVLVVLLLVGGSLTSLRSCVRSLQTSESLSPKAQQCIPALAST